MFAFELSLVMCNAPKLKKEARGRSDDGAEAPQAFCPDCNDV